MVIWEDVLDTIKPLKIPILSVFNIVKSPSDIVENFTFVNVGTFVAPSANIS